VAGPANFSRPVSTGVYSLQDAGLPAVFSISVYLAYFGAKSYVDCRAWLQSMLAHCQLNVGRPGFGR